jgi:hypothetical protein
MLSMAFPIPKNGEDSVVMAFTLRRLVGLGVNLAIALLVAGCGGGASTDKGAADKGVTGAGAVATDNASGKSSDTSAEGAGAHQPGAPLSEADKALAAAQKFCPVSDEELGSMGAPVKLMVKGEPVFVCCKSCTKSVNAEPDRYLAKVAEFKKANAE